MKKLFNSPLQCLRKVWILMALSVVMAFSASAQIEWQDLELGVHYNEANIYGVTADYKFTPQSSGVLTVWSQDQIMHVYTALNADGTDVDYNSMISQFAYDSYTHDGVTFSKKTTSSVTAGETYYLASGKGFSRDKVFVAVMDSDVTELTLESVSQPVGEMYNITDARDGQVELEFNLPADADDWAILTVGTHTAQIETRNDTNTGKIVYALKPTLTEWMEAGYFEPGENMTLSITGLHAATNDELIYGTDGSLELQWTTPAKPHYHLSTTGITEFLSYWIPGDERGIAVLEFDYDLMTKEDGQTATALIQIGNAEVGDAYEEKIDSEKITVDGKKLYVDFTGKLRSYETMGLNIKWSDITVKIGNILMADGTSSFNASQGNYGSVTFSLPYTEYRSDIQAEFTPADGATLTDNFFKVYFSDKKALTFGGVRVNYQTLDDIKYQVDITEGITSEEVGQAGIEYTIPLTDEIVAGKNIRIAFIDQVSADGYTHDFNVKYNPGPELINDLLPVTTSVKDGDIVAACENITLTFDSEVVINTVDAPASMVMFNDLTNGKTIPATIAVSADDAKTVVITPSAALTDAHKYNVYVNSFVVVNQEYIDQNAKYGRYMPGYEVNFTLSKLYDNYDFATDPIVGATVSELSRIHCYTKEGADAYYETITPTRDPEVQVYVNNEAGQKVTNCSISDDVPDGFVIVLDEPITESGKYTVVLPAGVYNTGEGYGTQPQEVEVRLSYTVLSAPEEVITITAVEPTSESTVASLKEIKVEFSEPVYGDDVTISINNKTAYTSYNATLSIDPTDRTKGVIQVEEEIIEEGSYTVYIPNGVVGDETWYNNDAQTGKCNTYAVFYFSVNSQPGGDVSDEWTTDPANGSTITSLHEIHVWNSTVEYLSCGAGKCVLYRDGVELEKIADATWEGCDNNELKMFTSVEYTEDGVYTFEVPEGFFIDDFGGNLPAVTFTWYLGESGVNALFADGVNLDVYSLDGRLVMKNVNKNDVMDLDPGIYVIGGKKVYIRK
ncbi:MAG: Ig-like domain-containing protein [Lepagella sp.]